MTTPASSNDVLLRAMTDDASFRVVVANTSRTVAGVLDMQGAAGDIASILADLTTGVTLIRETMSPALRVQAILKGNGSGYLLADSHPSGKNRGLVSLSQESQSFSLTGRLLQVVRTLHDGRIQQGVVAVGDGQDVSAALMTYMQESEQVTTMISVATVRTESELRAGGYLVQLLPGAERGALAIMTERLEDFRRIDRLVGSDGFSARFLLDELFYGMPHTMLGESNVEPGCWCSRGSVMGALSSLSRADIESMIGDGKPLEINCDYCSREYAVSPVELHGLLQSN